MNEVNRKAIFLGLMNVELELFWMEMESYWMELESYSVELRALGSLKARYLESRSIGNC